MHQFYSAGGHGSFRRHPTIWYIIVLYMIVAAPSPSFKLCVRISAGRSVSFRLFVLASFLKALPSSLRRHRTHCAPVGPLHFHRIWHPIRYILGFSYCFPTTQRFHARPRRAGFSWCGFWYSCRHCITIHPKQNLLGQHGEECDRTCPARSVSFSRDLLTPRMSRSHTPFDSRLHMAIIGGILAPVGLWWFAWCVKNPHHPTQAIPANHSAFLPLPPDRTSTPSIHWIVPIVAGVPFGVGVAQILQSLTAYLMDTYNIYFASAIAATVVLRSFCGAAFPLFSPAMFNALGDQWAMSIFAILSTVCMPIPVLFWVYLFPILYLRPY